MTNLILSNIMAIIWYWHILHYVRELFFVSSFVFQSIHHEINRSSNHSIKNSSNQSLTHLSIQPSIYLTNHPSRHQSNQPIIQSIIQSFNQPSNQPSINPSIQQTNPCLPGIPSSTSTKDQSSAWKHPSWSWTTASTNAWRITAEGNLLLLLLDSSSSQRTRVCVHLPSFVSLECFTFFKYSNYILITNYKIF